MVELSYTQEFLLCVLKPQGSIPIFNSTQISTCLIAGGILELLNLNVISMNEKKIISLENGVTLEKEYLRPLYQVICASKKKNIKDIASQYVFGTGKLLEEYIKSLTAPLVENKLVTIQMGGLFHKKALYEPNEEAIVKIIEKIRAEFLEKGPISDETIVLGALLYKSDAIKRYFSKYESSILKDRLNEVKQSEAGYLVKEMVDYIDALLTIIASLG